MIRSPTITARKLNPLSRKHRPIPKIPMVSPATAGPMTRAALNIAELKATALATSSRPTISTTKDWRVGMSTALAQPSRKREHQDVPDLDEPVAISAARASASSICDDLGRDQGPALREVVGDHAAEQAEHQHRRESAHGHETERERIVGELEDEPALGDGLHPRADERDQLAEEEQPVVAVAERRAPTSR